MSRTDTDTRPEDVSAKIREAMAAITAWCASAERS